MTATSPAPSPGLDSGPERPRAAFSRAPAPRRWGVQRPTTPGRYLHLEHPEGGFVLLEDEDEVVHLGRGMSCEVRIDDHHASRRQAILLRRATGHRLLADGGATAPLVNGRRVEQADLHDGDVIVLGRTVLRYLAVG